MSDEPYDFPYATAPEIVRASQKDIYVQSLLREKIVAFIESLRLNPRLLQHGALGLTQAIHGLYLCLTTLIGSPTLGEEYCDIFYRTGEGLSSTRRRLGFVLTSSLGPVLLERWLVRLMTRLGLKLETSKNDGFAGKLATGMKTLTENVSLQSLITINLAIFYFFGKYHQISQRLWGMRYAFGHKVNPLSIQSGYEILGVMIVSQLLGKLVLDIYSYSQSLVPENAEKQLEKPARSKQQDIDLADKRTLSFIPQASRVCTLCLEPMKSPTATLCGHLFCWSCVAEWCREKPECPLCRQACLEQNLLPIR